MSFKKVFDMREFRWAASFVTGVLCCGPVISSARAETGQYSNWQLNVGADERIRYEYKNNFDLKDTAVDSGSLLFQRALVNAKATLTDEYLTEKADGFIELADCQAGGSHYVKSTAVGQRDDLDLFQAYVDLYDIGGSGVSTRLGRQKLQYGKGRIVAAPTWANRMRSFDAGVVTYKNGGLSVDALYGNTVQADDNNVNRSGADEWLTGVYAMYQEQTMAPQIEGYYFDRVDKKLTTDDRRQTVGVRGVLKFDGGYVWDTELPYQFGTLIPAGSTVEQRINAYAFHSDISKANEGVAWKPKPYVNFDYASGDRSTTDDKSNTFVPIYQSTHDPYGLMDMIRWQNMKGLETGVVVAPTEQLKITPQYGTYWLQNKRDSWYSTSGSKTRTATVSQDRSDMHLGSELSLRVNYDFTKNIKFETGCAHFISGGYMRHTTGGDDSADWVYTQLSLKY